MDRKAFEAVVRDVLATLPAWTTRPLANVAVLVEERDADDPDLYGVYDDDGVGPARVIIFRRPLVEDFPDVAELRAEIRITVLHEIGHHFGLDEDRLDELGYA
jgi:predicted Zn-dependent protease with MMP-like domain